jgi:hypothetical protein
MSGTSKENHTPDGLGEVVFIAQEEEPAIRKRSAKQSLEDCSEIRDTKSGRLVTDRKSSGTKRDRNLTHYFISCNKIPVSRNKILLPTDKGTPLPKKINPQNCDKSLSPTNGELLLATDRFCISRIEATVENCNNNSQTVRKKELSVADIKSTRKQILENYEKDPTTASDTTDGGERRKNQIPRKETPVSCGEGVPVLQKEIRKENVYSLYIKKGNQSVVKDVPVYRKGTLTENYTRTPSEQKLLSGIEQNKQNSGIKEKQILCYGREKIIKNCDTDPALRREKVLFSGKEVAISRRRKNETTRRTSLLFSDTETSTSEDTTNAENCSKSPVSWKEKLGASVSNITMSGANTNVENCYTRPFQMKEDALLSRTEVNLGYCDGGQILRKNKLLTIDKQVLLSTVQDKLSAEDEESVECVRVQVPDSGEKNETSAIGVLLANDGERDPVAGRERHKRNLLSTRKKLCEQNATSKPVESCTEIKRREKFASEFDGFPMSDEDCIEETLEDASTVIIHPLLSCKYEHEVAKIRKKLKNLCENLKDKDRGPLVIHDESKQII